MNIKSFVSISKCTHKLRLGNQHDGGYVLCERDVRESDFLLSFGVNDDWSFEEAFLSVNSRVSVHAYDHSIDFPVMLKKSFAALPNLILGRIGISEFLRRSLLPVRFKIFFAGVNVHFKEKVAFIDLGNSEVSIDSIFSRTSSSRIFLKMDIEGSEYEVFSELVKKAERLTGMVIEFHDIGIELDSFLSSLSELSNFFDITHIHGNNYDSLLREIEFPNVVELTFSRKGIHNRKLSNLSAPTSGLDSPNNPREKDLFFNLNTTS